MLLTRAACALVAGLTACGPQQATGSHVGVDGGSADAGGFAFATIDDLPACNALQPDLACIERLFLPLRGTVFPFDGAKVAAAFGHNEFHVANTWQLTALHVLEANSQFPFACFYQDFQWAQDVQAPLQGPGCGAFLVMGGHPHTAQCRAEQTFMSDCVDQVPFPESFDVALVQAAPSSDVLELWSTTPRPGDAVYVVGYPSFSWLTEQQREQLAPLYPLVSSGKVLAIEGRGVVHTAITSFGNSGGAVLNSSGQVIGVTSTLAQHMRLQGTAVPDTISDQRAVAAFVTPQLKEMVSRVHPP